MNISCHSYLSLRKVEGPCMYGRKVRHLRGCQCGEGEGHFFLHPVCNVKVRSDARCHVNFSEGLCENIR